MIRDVLDYVKPTAVAHNLWMGMHPDLLNETIRVEHVVSLEPWTPPRVGLKSHLVALMLDAEDQPLGHVPAVAAYVVACRHDGPTYVHCQAGLNRSGVVVARALMLEGYSADRAITVLRKLRGPDVLFNEAFVRWLESEDKWRETA